MPFGFITQKQLDRHAEELRNEVRRCETMMEEWYDKFRRLYARLSKRVADAEQQHDEGGTPGEGGPAIVQPEATSGEKLPADSPVAFNRRRMRGF